MRSLIKELSQLNTKKSKGEDDIEPYLLCLSAHLVAPPLAHLINLTFISGEIPSVWKTAQVVPLFKGGDLSDLNNYRPISKLCCLAKVHWQMNSYDILQSQPSGFRPGHSTATATSLVINNILNGLDSRKHCAALFIDLSKAFDTVDHGILLRKLSSIGLDDLALNWFLNYLSGRKQSVVANSTKSSFLVTD